MDGEWTRDGLGTDWRWTGQGVEGLKVDSTRTPWTRGGLHRDSTRISGGVINTARTTSGGGTGGRKFTVRYRSSATRVRYV